MAVPAPALGRGGGNAEQPLLQEGSNIVDADLSQGLGNPVCTHTLKAHLAACRTQMRREMGQENLVLLRSSTWTCLLQLVLQRGTFSGAAVKTALSSSSSNSLGTEEVLSEGKICLSLSVVPSSSREWEPGKSLWLGHQCIVPLFALIYDPRYQRLCLSS